MKFKSYELSRPINGVCKSYALWGNNKATSTPLIYFRKPKWMDEESFKKLMSQVSISIPNDFLFEKKESKK